MKINKIPYPHYENHCLNSVYSSKILESECFNNCETDKLLYKFHIKIGIKNAHLEIFNRVYKKVRNCMIPLLREKMFMSTKYHSI